MGDAMVTAGTGAAGEASAQPAFSPSGEVLRDITRGGIAGIVVGGLGAWLVMRLVAMLHPDAVGALTENGNRIGDITMGGTVTLVLLRLITCAMAGRSGSSSAPGSRGIPGSGRC